MHAVVRTGRRYRSRHAGSEPKALPLPFQASPAFPSGHPEGGGHGWPPFSDQAMDGLSENGDGTPHALSDLDVTRKAVFFGYFLLGQQKKVPRPQGRNEFDLALYDTQNEMEFRQGGRRAFAFRRVTFFAGAKKVTKESTFLVKSNPLRECAMPSPFSDSASCLGRKTAAIHGRRPPGFRTLRLLGAYGKSRPGVEATT